MQVVPRTAMTAQSSKHTGESDLLRLEAASVKQGHLFSSESSLIASKGALVQRFMSRISTMTKKTIGASLNTKGFQGTWSLALAFFTAFQVRQLDIYCCSVLTRPSAAAMLGIVCFDTLSLAAYKYDETHCRFYGTNFYGIYIHHIHRSKSSFDWIWGFAGLAGMHGCGSQHVRIRIIAEAQSQRAPLETQVGLEIHALVIPTAMRGSFCSGLDGSPVPCPLLEPRRG